MVSVIVLSWNAKDEVLACIHSLLAIAKTLPLEVVVVDNASQDGSVEALSQVPNIKLVKNSTNRLYAAGNNQAYALTSGEYVLILNQDTIVNLDAVQASVHWLQQHADYGAVTVRLRNDDGSTQYYMHRRLPQWYDIPLALLHKRWSGFLPNTTKRYLYLDQTFNEDFDIEQAAGTYVMVRRSAIQQLGYLFNERFFPLYYNDVDLCRRLHQAGWKIRLLANVSIQHHKGTSVRKLPKLKNLKIYLKALYYYFFRSAKSSGIK
jgi:GT2 family glycosyltransferase